MKTGLNLLIALLLLNISTVSGKVVVAEGISLNAEFRPRFEFDNRDFSSGTGYDFYSSMRTRIGLRLDNLIENTNLFIMFADSRMLGYSNPYLTGIPPGPNGYDNNVGISKVYIEVMDIWRKGTRIKAGRMSNDQGRSYIFGPGNWNLFGPRTYDGIKLGYSIRNTEFNLWSFFGANGDRHWYPEEDDPKKYPDSDSDFKRDHTLTGLDISLWSKTINLLLFLDLDQKPVTDTVNHTTNISLKRTTTAVNLHWFPDTHGGYRFDFDAAYQFGTVAHPGGNSNISAYMLASDWSWHSSCRKGTWFGFGFHLTSGDNANDPDKTGYFYDNYSSKHKTFGHMDYFKSPTGIKSKGIRDFVVRAGSSPFESMTCQLNFHRFTLEKSYSSVISGNPSHNLGFEIDTLTKFYIRNGLTVELGVDCFIPDRNWKNDPNDISTFLYIVMTATI